MTYTVEVEFNPLYELVASLAAYSSPSLSRSLYLDKDWWDRVKQALPPLPFKAGPLQDAASHGSAVLLIRAARSKGRSPAAFTKWLRNLTAAELRSTMAAFFNAFPFRSEADLLRYRTGLADVIDFWAEFYLPIQDPDLIPGLARRARADRQLALRLNPLDLIEELTNGIRLQERSDNRVVLLIPQYHCRPINLFSHFQGLSVYLYPTEALPADPGEPPSDLIRMTSALSDSSRLKMLRLLATESLSFTELVAQTGLAKSTVHHHLMILRAAGLLWIHDRSDSHALFELRPSAGDRLRTRLDDYFRGNGFGPA